MRFEAPKPNNRWDSPLFVIQKDDTLPYEAISDAIFKRKAPPPNASTLPVSIELVLKVSGIQALYYVATKAALYLRTVYMYSMLFFCNRSFICTTLYFLPF